MIVPRQIQLRLAAEAWFNGFLAAWPKHGLFPRYGPRSTVAFRPTHSSTLGGECVGDLATNENIARHPHSLPLPLRLRLLCKVGKTPPLASCCFAANEQGGDRETLAPREGFSSVDPVIPGLVLRHGNLRRRSTKRGAGSFCRSVHYAAH